MILLRLLCSPSNLHMKGLSSWWITSKIQFCLAWFLWWLRQGAIGPLEATPLWVNVDWSDYWIDSFKLQPLAFCFSPFCAVLRLPLSIVNPWNLHPFASTAVPNNHKLPFSAAQAFRISAWQSRQQACPFPAGVVTLVSGEASLFVHLIRWNLNSRLCPCGWIWLGSLLGTTHEYLGLNWALFINNFAVFTSVIN